MQLQTPYGQKSGGQSLQPLINTLLLNASFIDNIGLMHGKMGISVYFFHLARSTRNKVYEEYAGELIDEIYEEIIVNTPVNFENGLAGIGWGIEYLVQNGFIEADTDEVLEDYPVILWFLAELYGQNIFSFKVEKIIQRFIGKLSQENNLPKLHSNRLLLALALTRLGKITNAHQITHEHSGNRALNQSGIESLINNLLIKINRNTIDSELPPGDATIRHGTSGIAWIYNQLHRLEGGSHFKNEMGYWNNKLSLHKDKDSLLTRHYTGGENTLGILEGPAGIMLLAKPIKKEVLK